MGLARAVPIRSLLPDFGLIPLGTVHLLSLPIYGEAVAIVGPLLPGLQAVVHPTRTDQANTELLPAADEHFGVDVGRPDGIGAAPAGGLCQPGPDEWPRFFATHAPWIGWFPRW